MRVLVTGGAGFIGSFVVDRLLAAGHSVRVLDVLDPQVHPTGRPLYLAPEAELVVGDVRDRATCAAALVGIEAVVHAAAAVGVGQSLYRVEHYVDVNVRGTATLLDCLVAEPERPRKLLVFTSMTGYGEGCYRRPSDGASCRVAIRSADDIARDGWEPVAPDTREPLEAVPTDEDAELQARNVYALTKRYQEELAMSLGAVYGFPVVCLRLFNVYGPRQALTNPYTGVLAIFLSRLLAGESPVVYEDGRQSRDFISVHDVADTALAVLTTDRADGRVVNLGSGVARPIADIARELATLTGRTDLPPRITGQFRAGDVRHCTANIERARTLLGFSPRVSWEAGLSELLTWCQSSPSTDRFAQAHDELATRGLLSSSIAAPAGASQS
ncbi:MAG TPA: NAD-dependent epimerase/dehydratase family protein [Candidatus Binatia bacterium]|jgi:dTDP-L-rhamnose 4-epimerase|nr:NAD-dependent epimerase/dehydratase family protein [Candidatus Binatia bacterium]